MMIMYHQRKFKRRKKAKSRNMIPKALFKKYLQKSIAAWKEAHKAAEMTGFKLPNLTEMQKDHGLPFRAIREGFVLAFDCEPCNYDKKALCIKKNL
eukprot:UN07440